MTAVALTGLKHLRTHHETKVSVHTSPPSPFLLYGAPTDWVISQSMLVPEGGYEISTFINGKLFFWVAGPGATKVTLSPSHSIDAVFVIVKSPHVEGKFLFQSFTSKKYVCALPPSNKNEHVLTLTKNTDKWEQFTIDPAPPAIPASDIIGEQQLKTCHEATLAVKLTGASSIPSIVYGPQFSWMIEQGEAVEGSYVISCEIDDEAYYWNSDPGRGEVRLIQNRAAYECFYIDKHPKGNGCTFRPCSLPHRYVCALPPTDKSNNFLKFATNAAEWECFQIIKVAPPIPPEEILGQKFIRTTHNYHVALTGGEKPILAAAGRFAWSFSPSKEVEGGYYIHAIVEGSSWFWSSDPNQINVKLVGWTGLYESYFIDRHPSASGGYCVITCALPRRHICALPATDSLGNNFLKYSAKADLWECFRFDSMTPPIPQQNIVGEKFLITSDKHYLAMTGSESPQFVCGGLFPWIITPSDSVEGSYHIGAAVDGTVWYWNSDPHKRHVRFIKTPALYESYFIDKHPSKDGYCVLTCSLPPRYICAPTNFHHGDSYNLNHVSHAAEWEAFQIETPLPSSFADEILGKKVLKTSSGLFIAAKGGDRPSIFCGGHFEWILEPSKDATLGAFYISAVIEGNQWYWNSDPNGSNVKLIRTPGPHESYRIDKHPSGEGACISTCALPPRYICALPNNPNFLTYTAKAGEWEMFQIEDMPAIGSIDNVDFCGSRWIKTHLLLNVDIKCTNNSDPVIAYGEQNMWNISQSSAVPGTYHISIGVQGAQWYWASTPDGKRVTLSSNKNIHESYKIVDHPSQPHGYAILTCSLPPRYICAISEGLTYASKPETFECFRFLSSEDIAAFSRFLVVVCGGFFILFLNIISLLSYSSCFGTIALLAGAAYLNISADRVSRFVFFTTNSSPTYLLSRYGVPFSIGFVAWVAAYKICVYWNLLLLFVIVNNGLCCYGAYLIVTEALSSFSSKQLVGWIVREVLGIKFRLPFT